MMRIDDFRHCFFAVQFVKVKDAMSLKYWIREHGLKSGHGQEIRFAGTPT